VPHGKRSKLSRHHPVHVTWRMLPHVPNLRSRKRYVIIERAFLMLRANPRCRVVAFSIQGNHVHLLMEADHERALAGGLKSLGGRIAKGLNRLMGRRGEVFADRCHARPLKTPRETRNALAYVLGNYVHHREQREGRLPVGLYDAYSSAPYFDGWAQPAKWVHLDPAPVTPAQTWLLTQGWRRYGLLRVE
jgi:REP element-mobilizing transposase RayT